jgi:hypothetical protein
MSITSPVRIWGEGGGGGGFINLMKLHFPNMCMNMKKYCNPLCNTSSVIHCCEILVRESTGLYNFYELNEEVFGFSWAHFESGLLILGKTNLKS